MPVVTSQYRVGGQNKSLEDTGDIKAKAYQMGREMRESFRDDIHVCISSVQRRKAGLKRAVFNLLPQCDRLHVFLADYKAVPNFLRGSDKIHAVLNSGEDRGSIEKFRWHNIVRGYYITCDDDVLYPKDYTARLVVAIEKYKRQAVVGFHGAVISKFPVENYYKNRVNLHFGQRLAEDTPVHVVGNVCGGHHTSTLPFGLSKQKPSHTQDDIWLAIAAQKMKVPMVCLKREQDWIRSNPQIDQRGSIYDTHKAGCQPITDSINALGPWQLYGEQLAAA